MCRGKVYELINSGQLRTVLMVKPGRRRGIRLIELASFDSLMQQMVDEQDGGLPFLGGEN